MSVTGLHALIYTPAADELRTLLTDAFGLSHIDAGEDWLIYALPPAELGVHPGSEPRYELSLMCDDITSTMNDLRAKGVRFNGEPEERGWGAAVTIIFPGGVEMMLYQPAIPPLTDQTRTPAPVRRFMRTSPNWFNPAGGIPSGQRSANPHGYVGRVGREGRKCSRGAYTGAYTEFGPGPGPGRGMIRRCRRHLLPAT